MLALPPSVHPHQVPPKGAVPGDQVFLSGGAASADTAKQLKSDHWKVVAGEEEEGGKWAGSRPGRHGRKHWTGRGMGCEGIERAAMGPGGCDRQRRSAVLPL